MIVRRHVANLAGSPESGGGLAENGGAGKERHGVRGGRRWWWSLEKSGRMILFQSLASPHDVVAELFVLSNRKKDRFGP